MIEPYQALGLVPTMRGIRRRHEIETNLEHLSHLIKAASWLSSLDLPVRLIAIPEGALQGFNDEVLDLDHEEFARECAIDIPGPETDYLGKLAVQWSAFLMAQAKARHPEFPGRFFNVGFILSPDGEVILRHHKVMPLLPVEHSVTPHNVWDKWIELYGRNLDAFYPVADTEIGRLGFLMANEGSYPENARGLAMNGAEVVYRGPYPHPHVGNGLFEVQNRARALDNNLYLIACNVGTYYLNSDSDVPIDTFGGGSAVIDYRGQIVGRQDYSGASTWVAGTIDINALRQFRANAQWDNWIELYGRNLDAFYPVADTEIGRLGFLMANEGSYPENARGLAMNGAEVVYRGPYPHPHVGNGLFEVQNRARALDNNLYLIACNVGTYYLNSDSDVPIDTFGGGSAVIDYRGQIIGRQDYSGASTWVAGTIDINALRHFRANAQWDNWIKDLTTEQYQLIYEEPVYPKNIYLDRVPYGHDEYRREVIAKQIELMHERDIWVPPDKADSASRSGTPSLQPAPRSRLRERSVRADST